MSERFPQELFVANDNESGDEDDDLFDAARSAEKLAEFGDPVQIGVYRLVRVTKVNVKAEVE